MMGRATKNGANFEVRLSNGSHPHQTSTLEQLTKGSNGELVLDLLVDL